MKRGLFVGLSLGIVAWTTFGFGADAPEAPMPPAANAILTQMDREIVAAKQKAITLLDKVLKDTTKKGDLAAAMEVKEAIDQLKADVQPVGNRSGGARVPTTAIVGTWSDGHNNVEFMADGSCTSAGKGARWQVNGKAVEIKWSYGYTYNLTMSPEGLVGTKFDAGGKDVGPVKLTRAP